VVEGENIAEAKVEAVIRRQLGLPETDPPQKGLFGQLFGG
jgi:hypothetical protein